MTNFGALYLVAMVNSIELWMLVIMCICIVTEALISAVYNFGWYKGADTAVNIALSSLNFFIDLFFKAVTFFVLTWFNKFAIIEWTNMFWCWFFLILLEDLAYYAMHWVDHNVRFFWAIHVNHHSSVKMNASVAIRSSVLQPLYRFIFFIPLAILGFTAWQIFMAYLLTNFWGFFIHTEMIGKLGMLDKIFATPSNHRVHHGSNAHYLDRNMGMFLIIWDRIFGTYQAEDEKVIYGLTNNINTNRLDKVILHEWQAIFDDVKKAKGFYNKWMYVFGPPGWSHDGHKQTSKQLRLQYYENKQTKLIND